MLSKELQLGKAAEHLVIADLTLQGYQAFLADQGSQFDVVVQHKGRLFTIQVKATRRPKLRRRARTESYLFGLRWGKQQRNLDITADIYAFVALDTKTIAYMKAGDISKGGQLIQVIEFRSENAAAQSIRTCPGKRGHGRHYTPRILSSYPITEAL